MKNKTTTLTDSFITQTRIFDHIDSFVAIADMATRNLLYVNNEVLTLFEVQSANQLVGKKIPNLRKYNLTDEKINTIFDTVECGYTYTEEVEYVTSKGKEFWGILKVQKIKIDNLNCILYNITDISNIKNIEIENKRYNERLKLAINAAGDGLWDWDIYNNSIFLSAGWKKIIGYEDTELDNTMGIFESLLHPDDIERVQKTLKFYIENYNEYNYYIEFRMLCKDGKYKWIRSKGAVVKTDKYGNALRMVGTHSDINDLKKYQEELKNYSIRLEKSNADIKQFAYITTHDLKEPLRTISNNIQLLKLKNKTSLDETSLQLIDYSVEGCKKLMNIIKELLDYAQLENSDSEKEFVDINKVVKNVLSNLDLYIKSKNSTIVVSQLPEDVFVNRVHLSRVFQNLITNAIKYNQNENPYIMINAAIVDDQYRISISDNGIGIAKEYENQVYEMFKRLKTEDNSESVGMGLAVCRKIIEANQGRLWHESEVGVGTTFYFTLPYVIY